MKKEDVVKVRDIINAAYSEVNEMVTFRGVAMLDLVCPCHDGRQDAEAVSEMMLLRQDANGLMRACEVLVEKITDALGDDEDLLK